MSDLRAALVGVPALSDLPPPHLERLLREAAMLRLNPAEALCREGVAADAWFAVVEGRFRASRTRSDGGQEVLGSFLPGALVGIEAICGPGRYGLTVAALVPGRVVRFPGSLLRMPEEPGFVLALRERLTWALDGWLRILTASLEQRDREERRWTVPP